ncbi:Protein ALP1-like [Pseudolycoriella hygida]|uniref:Protein ALP1-like n=1 Tax=Pseudolycoriella hygida TaxID=35572 RepID=A0A9Q0S2G1_9DIPT|nr:Protein ALP1-like [Pseudolycoriella hygida]
MRENRRWAVHPINKSREENGEFATLFPKLEQYPERYEQYLRMSKDRFDFLLDQIKARITGITTNFKTPIGPKEKLVVTLRFLAVGSSYADFAFRFRMGASTIRKIVMETVEAIVEQLLSVVMSSQTQESWTEVADEFYTKWHFPNTVGAGDGKHIGIFCPPKSGSENFNYKKTFSVNLMALVDASYKFVMIDVGASGSNHDATVFWNSAFGKMWHNQDVRLNLPAPKPLPKTSDIVPYQIIADDAFGQTTTIMTPYPGNGLWREQRIFNYRLSRARRVVENAFGILCQVWRILLKRVEANVGFAKKLVTACCILHNFLKISLTEIVKVLNREDSTETQLPLAIATNRSSGEAVAMRNRFASYINSSIYKFGSAIN